MVRFVHDDEKRRTTMAVVDSEERVPRAVIFVQLKLCGMRVFHTWLTNVNQTSITACPRAVCT